MPNRRTLRRLARTGHPTLLTVAGHRARAVPPPPDARLFTVRYACDLDGDLVITCCPAADCAAGTTTTYRYDRDGNRLDPDDADAAAVPR